MSSCHKHKPKPIFYNSTRYRDSWSSLFIVGLAALTAFARMRQHAIRENKRRKCLTPRGTANGIKKLEWELKLGYIAWSSTDERTRAFAFCKRPWHWNLLTIPEYNSLPSRLRGAEKVVKGQLHGRQRCDVRISINGATTARERSHAQGCLTGDIRSI